MRELINLRKAREKHFLNEDGTITLYAYNHDVHYLKDGHFSQIDNTLIEKEGYFQNKENSFHFYLSKNLQQKRILKVTKENNFLEFFLPNSNETTESIFKNNTILYPNILNQIDIKYLVRDNKLKDVIVLKNKQAKIEELKFKICSNLDLIQVKNKIEISNQNQTIFEIESPTLMDCNHNYHNINYNLEKDRDAYYLSFQIDPDILSNEKLYPLEIDPTITNNSEGTVYDTYIYPNDTNVNRNDTNKLKVGVDSNNVIYRTLLKFDLPTIGTACEIIGATAVLMSHATDLVVQNQYYKRVNLNAHRVTTSWTEETANWNTMHNQYDEKIEDYFQAYRSESVGLDVYLQATTFSITNLVKRWYAGEENNGILLKFENEVYDPDCKEFTFYSKNNNIATEEVENPKPYLIISYRNYNGLESYMDYQTISHKLGKSYINYLTGNLTNTFEINKTIGGQNPISLMLLYNTNDVVLNHNYSLSTGYKWNYYQTLKEIEIEGITYLEYLDADGTIHYFYKTPKEENETDEIQANKPYCDEDGLNLTAKLENSKYVMTDKNGNKMYFEKIDDTFFLNTIIDTSERWINITYSNNKITEITNSDNKSIHISYASNKVTVSSDFTTTILYLTNNLITTIESKFGNLEIEYNTNNVVTKIKDTNGKKIKFDYYNQVLYRIHKVSELGINNQIGNTLEFIYGFLVTRVKDQKGRINTYSFNNQGNTIGITNLKSSDDFTDSYGIYKVFDTYNEQSKNRLLLSTNTSKYTNNLFSNHSFENTSISNYDKGIVVNENARSGNYCLKITEETKIALPSIKESIAYTFSGYFKTSGTGNISFINNSNETISEIREISKNSDYIRYDITGNFEKNQIYYLKIVPANNAIIYLDDIQFEPGTVANYINIVENSDFEDGFANWTYSTTNINGENVVDVHEIITLSNGVKVCKVSNHSNISTELKQEFNYRGKANETYKLSFWYKNEGIIEDTGDYIGNLVHINFNYLEEIAGEPYIYHLNPHATEWQYFQMTFTTKADYEKLYLYFISQNEVNNLYFTNITLTKDLENDSFAYDEKGNLISATDQANGTSTFNYDKNNQLVSLFEPKGNSFKFEYDNQETSKVLQGISKKGIANIIEYDENNNPSKTKIVNTKLKIEENKEFYIRLKGTKKYIFADLKDKIPYLKESVCNIDSWCLEKINGEENRYYIRSSIMPYYFSYKGDTTPQIVLKQGNQEAYQCEFVELDNGSYRIKTATYNQNCITYEDNELRIDTASTQRGELQEFYLEDATKTSYIETKAEYTHDGKFISKTIDSLGHVTSYDIDSITGLTKSITDPIGNTTSYTYNDLEQITKVTKENKSIEYQYNEYDLLSNIICDNKSYNFVYDDFLNTKQVKINNIPLVTNVYEENNGNLLEVNYGNNTSVQYTYDDLERLKTLAKNNKEYTCEYNNLNELVRIKSDDELYQYYYDFAQRISRYESNANSIDYDYDISSNVTNKKYTSNNLSKNIQYTYDEDDSIIKVSFDDNELNYEYDDLGRLKNKNINNNLPIQYEYFKNGDKTSLILKSMKIQDELYEYVYDDVYNITHIYRNKNLIHYYKYDKFNELIKEENHIQNKIYFYQYDNAGNIQKKQEYNLQTNDLEKEDIYEYSNVNWKDQLTKYNNIPITYDAIGNPTSIGNITLTWDARELQSYQNDNLTIQYFYNKDGIRSKKIVNSITTNYFTENSSIIFEETNGNMIYYIRDDNSNLVGFIYNNNTYYYKKNFQEDIIGIYNSNYELIVNYEYDAWGKVIRITDTNGNIINDSNHIAYKNPFRYRSYYYDTETQLYYLNSRYYNPEWGRFINADGIIGTRGSNIGYNLYAYCDNEPIKHVDASGHNSLATAVGTGAMSVGISPAAIAFLGIVVTLSIATAAATLAGSAIKAQEKAAANNAVKGNHNVYVLADTSDSNHPKVEYVGRTTNIEARKSQHQNNPYKKELEMIVVLAEVPYEVARYEEENLINLYGTINRGNYRNNQIHGMSPNNPQKYLAYQQSTYDYFGEEIFVGGIEW